MLEIAGPDALAIQGTFKFNPAEVVRRNGEETTITTAEDPQDYYYEVILRKFAHY